MRLERLWLSQDPSARAARLALLPLAALYAGSWQAYRGLYRFGLKARRSPHRPIVCVGNLTVGGSGKTPAVLALADVLIEMRREVVIGCSGYGSPAARGAAIAPEGLLPSRDWGDEPAVIRDSLPQVPLVVGRARVAAAEIVAENFPRAVLLMDDGFQHLPLETTLTFLLDDPNPPNPFTLPAGPYREPRRNRALADFCIPGDFELEFQAPEVERHGPARSESRIALLCAIARPDRFQRDVEACFGTSAIMLEQILPDHDPLNDADLFSQIPDEMPCVVTHKDWVKLRDRRDVEHKSILVMLRKQSIQPKERLMNVLSEALNV